MGYGQFKGQRPQAPGQRRFADEDSRPEPFEELSLGQHTVAMLDEVSQHLEHFGLNSHGLARTPQFISRIVELVVAADVELLHAPVLPQIALSSVTPMLPALSVGSDDISAHVQGAI